MLDYSGKIIGTSALAFSSGNVFAKENNIVSKDKLKIVCVGAHPDDCEVGCGGTIALFSDLGHDIVFVYMTRGEAGIKGKSHEEAAMIRTEEAIKACEILKVRPVFAGQIDGNVEFTKETRLKLLNILQEEKPDLVFTLWPIDTHPDHTVCSILVQDVWRKMEHKFALYFFEVTTGMQSQNFRPTDYVDITPVIEKKKSAVFSHISQRGEEKYGTLWEPIEKFRGNESGCRNAEAFIHHSRSPKIMLP